LHERLLNSNLEKIYYACIINNKFFYLFFSNHILAFSNAKNQGET